MAYTVTAAAAVVHMKGGRQIYLAQGAPVPEGVEPDHLEHLSTAGIISKVDDGTDGPPARSASKAAWVAFAESQADGDADKLALIADASKEELIAEFGGE